MNIIAYILNRATENKAVKELSAKVDDLTVQLQEQGDALCELADMITEGKNDG